MKRVAVKGAAAWLTLTLGLLLAPASGAVAHPTRHGASVVDGAARFQVITPTLIRMEYAADGRFEDRPTFNAIARDRDAAAVFGALAPGPGLEIRTAPPGRCATRGTRARSVPATSACRSAAGRFGRHSARRRETTRSAAGTAAWTTTRPRPDRSISRCCTRGCSTGRLVPARRHQHRRGTRDGGSPAPPAGLPGRLPVRLLATTTSRASPTSRPHRPDPVAQCAFGTWFSEYYALPPPSTRPR